MGNLTAVTELEAGGAAAANPVWVLLSSSLVLGKRDELVV